MVPTQEKTIEPDLSVYRLIYDAYIALRKLVTPYWILPEPRYTPEEVEEALREMYKNPKYRKIVNSLIGFMRKKYKTYLDTLEAQDKENRAEILKSVILTVENQVEEYLEHHGKRA